MSCRKETSSRLFILFLALVGNMDDVLLVMLRWLLLCLLPNLKVFDVSLPILSLEC